MSRLEVACLLCEQRATKWKYHLHTLLSPVLISRWSPLPLDMRSLGQLMYYDFQFREVLSTAVSDITTHFIMSAGARTVDV